MKILLDECVTKHLKPYLAEFNVNTVREMNWGGIKNGKLITLCVENGFDILITIDKNLQYQQALDKYPLVVVIINSNTSKVEELITFLPSFRNKLSTFQKHKAYLIDR